MTITKARAAIALATGLLAFAGIVAGDIFLLAKRFSDLDTRIDKLENALKVMNATTPDERYKQVIKELMAERDSGKPATAKTTVTPFHTLGGVYPADAGAAASAPATGKP